VALSERGLMNEREYDLLTAAPVTGRGEGGADKYRLPGSQHSVSREKTKWLRSIARAAALVRKLFTAELIDLELAALMGRERDPRVPHALAAIRAITKNGNEAAYRKAVNEAVRGAFGKNGAPRLEQFKRLWLKLSAAERRQAREWQDKNP
jgi:hypothetical protein